MKNIITDEIFMQLNEHFKSKGSIISFVKNDINSVYITIKDVYLDSINVYPNKQFYIELEKYLESKGIWNISYNNAKSCFWKID